MKIHWDITQNDIDIVSQFVNERLHNKFVSTRYQNNIIKKNILLSNENVWKHITMCLLTTQQRSGPNSKVSKFMSQPKYPLGKNQIKKTNNVYNYVYMTLTQFGGIRRTKSIAREIEYNFKLIGKNPWKDIFYGLKVLKINDSKAIEREVANVLDETIKGFGPKQSRSFLQSLGLTKYEIPLNSRIIKWFNEYFGFPIKLSSRMLSDINIYMFIEDAIQELCKKANIYPTILDACIFSNCDWEEWDHVDVNW